ncbi:MFS transporter [Comamonas piscis]|uniref:MFS transporter n=1 Tax=Comamonas piscis TaxID=1562974 RepID=A0A7G5EFV8_9BURK|nr:MFS transporter [Comamonas piscis]QMV72883.1 MFS transporter [Comamonas piscis]WSO35660.1 MFS transporter [Comamonas piscis]
MPVPPTPSPTGRPAAPPYTLLWAMLLTLLSAFSLSQAFRTVTSIIADGLRTDFGLSAESLGAFAGLFGLSFGVTQLFMGVGMDLYGLRKTVLTAFPLAIAGSLISALAPSYHGLMLGQLLIGIGCSPAFLACTMFIARHFPSERFAFMSGVGMGVGGLGLLFTGTPLAWLVQHYGWRWGFGLLAVLCALSWIAIFLRVHEPHLPSDDLPKPSWLTAVKGFGGLLLVPHTWAIAIMGMVGYASFLTVRGLWLSPMLIDRYGFSLVATGNVALVVSMISLFTPSVFGRLDPGPQRRRRRIVAGAVVMACTFCALAFVHHPVATVALIMFMGLASGYSVLQYADVRSSYPKETTGRALSVYTMAMFLGVALMQWLSGIVASYAQQHGGEIYQYVMLFVAGMLLIGCLAFRFLPQSPLLAPKSQASP